MSGSTTWPGGVVGLAGPLSVPVPGESAFLCYLVLLPDGQIGLGDPSRFLPLGARADVQRVSLSRGPDTGTTLATFVIASTPYSMTLPGRPGPAIDRLRSLGFTVGTRPVPGAPPPWPTAAGAGTEASAGAPAMQPGRPTRQPRAGAKQAATTGVLTRSGWRARWTWASAHPRWSVGAAVVALLLIVIAATSGTQGHRSGSRNAAHSAPATGQSRLPATQVPAPNRATSAPTAAATGTTTSGVAPLATPQAVSVAGTALSALDALAVGPAAPMAGYSRAQFGPAWTDDNDDVDGHNGCDTRNDILRRDLTALNIEVGTHGCTVLTGTLVDPYTATTIHFVRGPESDAVQIDHVVALGDAWQTGAQSLSAGQRVDLANDPLNLLAVQGAANDQKGDADAAGWLPSNRAEDCPYVARQIAVKVKYRLWVTPAEHSAMAGVLKGCPSQLLPTDASGPQPVGSAVPVLAPPPATQAAMPTPAAPIAPPPPPALPAPTTGGAPAGATARCNDGTYSFAAHHQGACSHHGGVAQFFH